MKLFNQAERIAHHLHTHSRKESAHASVVNARHKREEREAFKDAGRHGCAWKLAGHPRGISRVADRLNLVALATADPEMVFLLPECASCMTATSHEERCESNESLARPRSVHLTSTLATGLLNAAHAAVTAAEACDHNHQQQRTQKLTRGTCRETPKTARRRRPVTPKRHGQFRLSK